MQCTRLALVVGMISLACMSSARSAESQAWGFPLYPSQHGAPPGYPGCFDDKLDADQGKNAKKGDPKYPQWGHPELQNYEGSVEHFRTMGQKYTPAINPFNHRTLIKNWKAVDLPGIDKAAIQEYEEPIYYVPMYAAPTFTGRKNAPVKVLRFGKEATLSVELGRLKRGMYAFRVIAAIETEHCADDPKPLVIRFSVNDGPKGEKRTWIRRQRAVDEFYCIAEWYFHAWDDRAFKVELSLEPETEMDLLIHNVDLHDALGGCPETVVKTKPTFYSLKARAQARAFYVDKGKLDRSWGPNINTPRDKGRWQGTALPADKRAARDDLLWELWPPAMMNGMHLNAYGKYDRATLAKEEIEKIGTWRMAFATRYGKNWDKVPVIKNEKLGLTYTLDDLLASKPLPDPYPYKDRGYGLLLKDKGGYFTPILDALNVGRMRGTRSAFYLVTGDQTVGTLALEYYYRNNRQAARDAAFLLCRLAFSHPAVITNMRRSMQQVVCRRAQCWGKEPILRRRYTRYPTRGMLNAMRAYDMLFDFIDGNEELARAVGRRVPWIKTNKDLRAFLDQRLLMLPMREMINHDMGSSHGTPVAAIQIATLIGNREATRPLMEHLFSATWDYPLPVSGIQDYIASVVTRDGTTTIGSFFYTAGGSPLLKVVAEIERYIQNGGDKKYNLADRRRFPKPFFGAYFNIDARVAGMWPPGIGDVGSPMQRYGHWFDSQKDAVRIGWKYLKDPRFAYCLKHYFGRAGEDDKEWQAIEKAAAGQRNPWMANRSRVLSCWAGILESGTQHDDHRFRRAATVRVGVGWGHSHRDTLDLQLYALGAIMAGDGGQRPGYGRPDCITTMSHNLVEVDGDGSRHGGNWEGYAWIRTLADMPGAQMLHAKAIPPESKAQVKLAERTVALIDVHEGTPSTKVPSTVHLKPGTAHAKDVVLPGSYALDVYRVAGGKRHTYCFHGCVDDEFTVNAQDRREVPLPTGDADKDDRDVHYMRKYVLKGYQHAGDAPKTVVATWRMGREKWSFQTQSSRIDEGKMRVYKCGAPEQTMYGPDYDPASPRKYTRLHLLNQEGARLLWGRWVSAPYTSSHGLWYTQLHAMHDGDKDRESVFLGVIETYAGDPVVESVREIDVAKNEEDALRAVAVEVKTTNGHRDLHFADGRPGTARQISVGAMRSMTVNGQYAYVSTRGDALRQASLAGGTELSVPGLVTIKPAQDAYEGVIQMIDQYKRVFEVKAKLPETLLDHSFWDVGNDKHRTSLEVTDVTPAKEGEGALVKFRKGLELVSTRVTAVDTEAGVVTGKLVSILMGAEEDNGMKPGMIDGLWATNENMSKWWSCTYTGGSRATGYTYKLTGAPVTAEDFPIGGAIRIWELGPSDTARLATRVSLRQDRLDAKAFELTANVAFELKLPKDQAPEGYEFTTDRLKWGSVPAEEARGMWVMSITEAMLETGTLYLRPAQNKE